MMCTRIGISPTLTSGFGMNWVSSCRRVPVPPQRMTTGTSANSSFIVALPVVRDGVPGRPRARPAEQPARLRRITHHGLRLVLPFPGDVEAELGRADPEAIA